jgi:hypothetical protein
MRGAASAEFVFANGAAVITLRIAFELDEGLDRVLQRAVPV